MNSNDDHRIPEAIDRADIAFWGVIAKAFPMVKHGDFGPEETFAWRDACEKAVRTWLTNNLPPLERLYAELEDRGFAPTYGDEGGSSLWVALEFPAERFDRRIEVRDNGGGRGNATMSLTLVDPSGELPLADCYYEDATENIAVFCRITHTAFEYPCETA